MNVSKSTEDFNWPKEALYKIHLDLHCPDWNESILSNFDTERVVSEIAATGTKVLYFFSKDCYGNAYYPTKIGKRHKCIGQRDLLGEVVEQAQLNGLQVVAYSVLWDNHAAEAHPDWRMRYADGTPAKDVVTSDGHGRWQYLCHNSPFAEYMCEMLGEVSQNYDVAGFHIDMLNMDFGRVTCYCDHCQRKFFQQHSFALPTEPNWDDHWCKFLEFRYQSVEEIATRMRKAIRLHKPNLPISLNFHGSPGFDWRVAQQPVRHSRLSDIGTAETYTPMFGNMYPGMAARFVRNLVPDRPFEMVPWRMNRITDFTIKPKTQLRWEALTALAAGGSVMLIDQPFHDGTLDEVAYELMREVFEEIEAKRQTFLGKSVKHIGLYYSTRNRDYFGRSNQRIFLLPVMGAYKALTESHFPIDFVFDETLTLKTIEEFPVIFLPNVAAMSSYEASTFREYVKRGGNLIATYKTSLHDEEGVPLEEFQLGDVFGIEWMQSSDCDTHYCQHFESDLGNGLEFEQYVLVEEGAHQVKATTAKPDGGLHVAFFRNVPGKQFFSHNKHPPYLNIGNAAFVNSYGKGRCVYFPFGIDASYASEHEQREHRILLRNAVRTCEHGPLIKIVNAPLNVEVEIRKLDDTFFVHLLSFHPKRQSTSLPLLSNPIRPSIRMEQAMTYEIELLCEFEIEKIKVWNSQSKCTRDQSHLFLVCSDIHEVIEITPKTSAAV